MIHASATTRLTLNPSQKEAPNDSSWLSPISDCNRMRKTRTVATPIAKENVRIIHSRCWLTSFLKMWCIAEKREKRKITPKNAVADGVLIPPKVGKRKLRIRTITPLIAAQVANIRPKPR